MRQPAALKLDSDVTSEFRGVLFEITRVKGGELRCEVPPAACAHVAADSGRCSVRRSKPEAFQLVHPPRQRVEPSKVDPLSRVLQREHHRAQQLQRAVEVQKVERAHRLLRANKAVMVGVEGEEELDAGGRTPPASLQRVLIV